MLTVLTNSAFKDLTERVENPTLDQIKEAAEKNNQVVVPTQEYDALMHPDEVAIKTHADRLSLNVMPIKEHAKLMEDLEKPTLEYLVNKAAKYDSIVVTKDANTKLEKLAYSPDVKHMAEIADAKDLVVVNKEEFANITKLANEPHEDHIISKAKNLGLVTINESDHRSYYSLLSLNLSNMLQGLIIY